MVSVDADWSSGATGMACAADIAATLRQIANAEATSIFMDFSFSLAATRRCCNLRKVIWREQRLTSNGDASGASAGGASGDANPNDGGASAGASDANALARA